LLKDYYYLTKPGIIYGNVLTAIAGFLLAANTSIDLKLLVATIIGTALVIACGCVINNYFDRDIDRIMARTKKRALVSGKISVANALLYSTILGILGFTVLLLFVNDLTALIGLIALVNYALVYTFSKRHTHYSTLIGTIAGSASIVAGYTAVTGQIDSAAIILFLIMFCFQMPHFYAIAIYRLKDYRAAKLPVLSVVKGVRTAKIRIVLYVLTFMLVSSLLSVYGYAGYIYLAAMVILGLGWLKVALTGFNSTDDTIWAKHVFRYSLIVILGISIIIPLGGLLP